MVDVIGSRSRSRSRPGLATRDRGTVVLIKEKCHESRVDRADRGGGEISQRGVVRAEREDRATASRTLPPGSRSRTLVVTCSADPGN